MNVSYSMVRRLYSEVSSTALRPHGGPRTGSHLRTDPPSLEKSGLEQSIMPLNSKASESESNHMYH